MGLYTYIHILTIQTNLRFYLLQNMVIIFIKVLETIGDLSIYCWRLAAALWTQTLFGSLASRIYDEKEEEAKGNPNHKMSFCN